MRLNILLELVGFALVIFGAYLLAPGLALIAGGLVLLYVARSM